VTSNTGRPTGISRLALLAQGIVSEQADCSLEWAVEMLRDTALVTDTTLEEVADDVVSGRVTFAHRGCSDTARLRERDAHLSGWAAR